MGTLDDALKPFLKKIPNLGGKNPEVDNPSRIPTGFFPLDLALGGGFPKGKVSMVYGPEDSTKSSLVLKLISNYQKLYPSDNCVYIDTEDSFSVPWASILGVDTESLYLLKPSYMEELVNLVKNIILSEDLGLLVIDSLASLAVANEIIKDADVASVGGSSRLITRLAREINSALISAAHDESYPTIVYVNQRQHKIGQMYGDPESIPGGNAIKFQCKLILRLHGKPVIDKKVNDNKPSHREVTAVVKKYKIPIISSSVKYDFCLIPHDGLNVGDSYDWPSIKSYMKELGLLRKEDGKWYLIDDSYSKLEDIKQALDDDFKLSMNIKESIIETLLENDQGTNSETEE